MKKRLFPGRENEFTEHLHYIDIRGKSVKDVSDLAALLKDWRNPQKELFHVIYTNRRGKVLAHTATTSDRVDSVEISIRELLYKIADRGKRLKASNIYAAHNHPSGDATPSQDDILLTQRLFREIKNFHSHVVLDHDRFVSISKGGILKEHKVNLGKSYLATGIEVLTHASAAKVFDAHYQNEEGKIGILVLNVQFMPVALEKVRYNPGTFSQTLKEVIAKHSGFHAILKGEDNAKDAIIKNIYNNPQILDVLLSAGKSKDYKRLGLYERGSLSGKMAQEDILQTKRVFESAHVHEYSFERNQTLHHEEKDFSSLQSLKQSNSNHMKKAQINNDRKKKAKPHVFSEKELEKYRQQQIDEENAIMENEKLLKKDMQVHPERYMVFTQNIYTDDYKENSKANARKEELRKIRNKKSKSIERNR